MKTAKITKIEQDGDCFCVTFNLVRGQYAEEFDLQQLGSNITVISANDNFVMVMDCELKVGDSITDEKGGEPILGVVRAEAEKKNFSIKKDSDYRDAFQQKWTGEGEN